MKPLLTILFLFLVVLGNAQSKKEREVLANARTLEMAIFENKDSLSLEKLFAKTVSFGQPDGRIENREEAIRNIVNNKSVYTYAITPSGYYVNEVADSQVVKHTYNTQERKPDNTQSLLSFSIESVWAKENGKWKLFRCQFVKL